MSLFFLSSCASQLQPETGYHSFQGRLLVIEPTKRWQVAVTWQFVSLKEGMVRLNHAATSRIVELRWQGEKIHYRDNQAMQPRWQKSSLDQLQGYGIVLAPQEIGMFLAGDVLPPGFKKTAVDHWQRIEGGQVIAVHWNKARTRLSMKDISHGVQAILVIEPSL
ncbi:MAG: hypothetical protein R8M38_09565 [Mariprofundaceae bacterium]